MVFHVHEWEWINSIIWCCFVCVAYVRVCMASPFLACNQNIHAIHMCGCTVRWVKQLRERLYVVGINRMDARVQATHKAKWRRTESTTKWKRCLLYCMGSRQWFAHFWTLYEKLYAHTDCFHLARHCIRRPNTCRAERFFFLFFSACEYLIRKGLCKGNAN